MKRAARRVLWITACFTAGWVIGARLRQPDPLDEVCETGRCPR